jgi:hypothetical protein
MLLSTVPDGLDRFNHSCLRSIVVSEGDDISISTLSIDSLF